MVRAKIFIFCTMILCIVVFINISVQHIGHNHYTKNNLKLYDLIQECTPNFHKYEYLVNIIPLLIISSLFYLPITTKIMEEFFIKFFIILIIRALTTFTTILPKHEKCEVNLKWTSLLLGGCYDKLFSGHTAFTTLWTLIFLNEKFINTFQFWFINLINSVAIITTHSHYTVDVILGFIITFFVYDSDHVLKFVDYLSLKK